MPSESAPQPAPQPAPQIVDENGQPVVHKFVRSLDLGAGTQILDNRLLVFVHLPKCAGRTFSAILDKWFLSAVGDASRGCYATGTIYGQYLGSGKGEAAAAVKRDRTDLAYLRGHLPYGVHAGFDLEPVYVTFLREPLARSRSHFAFGAERGGWTLDTPFADVVARGGIADNPMTRQLAGLTDPDAPCTEDTLAAALENLLTFSFVGLAEQFDLSLQVFLSLFGLPSVIYLDRGRGKSVALPDSLAGQIEPFITFDQRLYDSVAVEPVAGQTRPDLWVDSTVISVEPAPGQPIPIAGVDVIRDTLATRHFEFREPLADDAGTAKH